VGEGAELTVVTVTTACGSGSELGCAVSSQDTTIHNRDSQSLSRLHRHHLERVPKLTKHSASKNTSGPYLLTVVYKSSAILLQADAIQSRDNHAARSSYYMIRNVKFLLPAAVKEPCTSAAASVLTVKLQ
jgi:hypothetical protein